MLQRTQSLFIFLPVPDTGGDKSDVQRNHTWLTNQPINGEQRSFAKMTYSDIATYHNQQHPGGVLQQAGTARARGTPCQVAGLPGRLEHPADACYPGMKHFAYGCPHPTPLELNLDLENHCTPVRSLEFFRSPQIWLWPPTLRFRIKNLRKKGQPLP